MFTEGRIRYTWLFDSGAGTDKVLASARNVTQSLDIPEQEIGVRADEVGYLEDVDFTLLNNLLCKYSTKSLFAISEENITTLTVDSIDNVVLNTNIITEDSFSLEWIDNTGGANNADDFIYVIVENTTQNKKFAFSDNAQRQDTNYSQSASFGTVGDDVNITIGFVSQTGIYSETQTVSTTIQDLLYSLKYDGINDYLQIQSFNQFDFNQAFTLFFNYKNLDWSLGQGKIFTSSNGSQFFEISRSGAVLQFRMRNTFFSDEFLVNYTYNPANFPNTGILQIAYNGTPNNRNNINLRFDDNEIIGATIFSSLSGSIISVGDTYVGYRNNNPNDFFPNLTTFTELSIVDYAKTVGEMTTDFNNGTQSIGTGSDLLRIEPIYDTNITDLNAPHNFLSTDGLAYTIDILGKPAVLDLGLDFEPIT